ncbi:MAG: AAA family ATPase [Caulobacter sp.]
MSSAHAWPRWIDELSRSLPTCAQFVVYGNIRDDQLTPVDGELLRTSLITCMEERFRARGYTRLLVFNTAGGLRVLPEEAGQSLADDLLRSNSRLSAGLLRRALAGEGGPEIVRMLPELSRAVHASMVATALVVENASRLVRVPGQLDETELQLFAACEQVMHEAEPRYADQALFNPTIWLTDGVRDLPDWMVVAGERSRAIAVPLPDEDARQICAEALAVAIEPAADDQGLQAGARQFAALCQGLTLREMVAVTQIAGDQGTGLREIGDALRSYKVGDPQDPWRGQGLRDRLRDAPETIRGEVKGQEVAINQALDILVRAALGLSGAQAASSGGRPRGVLFFAGPTGVGKTQLAKAISSVVFGAQDAFVRFDMSEFSAEHADARLIGAPPGYIGYDAGGELVNAVRQQPFRVLLFDEIEKANPRILDKFLQVLEDGRLTDGRGDTVQISGKIIPY